MASSTTALSSSEEITEHAEQLRAEFLREYSERNDFDQRDITKVRNDLTFVENFVSHNRRHPENCMHHMVECLSWRKTFGINDIKFDDIDEALWRTGMATNHGFDKNGHNVVILNISKHKKDSKKALKLQRWIAFSFEMQRTVYPKNRMCMVFDMNGAGLSNMDMDLVRFIINSFKIYFPDLLEWMLIFNMPWILQAAWKIVQSWLSESGAAKIKFVTTETICEYIPSDNLLVKFGGSDPWEFDYDVEKKVMLKLMRDNCKDSDKQLVNWDEVELSDTEEFHEEESDEGDRQASTNGKQVRFSSGLPPTRQSRYGPEDGEEGMEYSSLPSLRHDQSVLRKGSASSSGFRRRQVSRLMSLQEPSHGHTADREANGSVPGNRQTDKPLLVGGVQLSPSHELAFYGEKDGDILSTLTLKNVRDAPVAYKVKTNVPLQYKVKPNLNIIDAKSIAKVQVFLSQGAKVSVQDKFLVQTYSFSESVSIPKAEQLPKFWKTLKPADVSEHKMRCRRLSDAPSRSAIKPPPQSTQQKSSSETASKSSSLDLKVQQLIEMNLKMERSVATLKKLNYLILVLLVLLGFLLTSLINKFVPF